MTPRTSDQLDKVLALADSTHEAEAIVAVRKARQMLSRDGLNFSDLARAASHRPILNRALSIFAGPQTHLATEVVQLRRKLDDLQHDMKTQSIQLEFWRRRSAELEQNFRLAQSEAERWRQLARDTVEKLWELGQEVRMDEFADDAPAGEDPERKIT